MFKKSLIPIVVTTALAGCGTDDTSKLKGNSNGAIEIVGSDFIAGSTLTTTLSDPDGILDETVSYLWSTTDANGNSANIEGATSSSYTITEAVEGLVVTASALYTDQAGFMQGVGASTTEILPTLDVSAFIVKGPVSGATCDIFSVDDSGVADATAQATSISDTSGAVSFVDVHFKGTGLISCTGGSYTDESTGETLDAPTLRAVIDVIEDVPDTNSDPDIDNSIVAPDYIVSLLTEMAVQAAADDLTTFSDEADTINARFGIRFDTTETYPTIIGADSLGVDAAEDADRYGSVLALISQLDADDTDSDISSIIAELTTDLSDDGAFSEDTLTAFETAQINLQTTSEVADDVNESLLDVIGSSVGYNDDPVAAIIEGLLSGTVNNTATAPLTGTVTVTDPNFEEDAIVIQTGVALDFGTFNISAEGNWSYTVDVANDAVAALVLGESVSDLVTIASIDGTSAEIEIRIAALTQVVKFSDPGGDSGELGIDVDNLRQGKLTASFYKEDSLGSDGNVKDAYITFYGSSGSVSESLVDLRIQGNQTDDVTNEPIEPRFLVRGSDNAAYPGGIITAPFVEDQFYEVDVTWDLDASEQITISIDGEVIGGGAFSTAAVVDTDFTSLDQWFVDGIQRIAFRFGDNDRTIPFGNFFVDNIEVYSDLAGTVSVFEDDFESYDEGETLDGDDSLYRDAVYAEVVVFDVGGTSEPTPAAFFNLAGAIASDETTSTGAVSVLDPDDGEAFITQSSLVGTYGTLDILEDGSWTYTLDTTNATIAALIVGERETDTFTIESVDGTTAELPITISGTIVVATGANNVARMADTTTTADAELRLTTDALAEGSISTILKLQAISGFTATEGVDEDNTAYISVYGGSASSDNLTGEIVFSNGAVKYRDETKSQQTIDGLTYADDTDIDVVIDWTATGYSVSIDGGTTFYGPYLAINTGAATQTYQIRIGSSSKESAKELLADDIVIADATDSVILSEDFETYVVGDDLSATYSSSAEATVQEN